MPSITVTKWVEVETEVDIELTEEDIRNLFSPELSNIHIETMVYALQRGDKDAVFNAAFNWIRENSSLAI